MTAAISQLRPIYRGVESSADAVGQQQGVDQRQKATKKPKSVSFATNETVIAHASWQYYWPICFDTTSHEEKTRLIKKLLKDAGGTLRDVPEDIVEGVKRAEITAVTLPNRFHKELYSTQDIQYFCSLFPKLQELTLDCCFEANGQPFAALLALHELRALTLGSNMGFSDMRPHAVRQQDLLHLINHLPKLEILKLQSMFFAVEGETLQQIRTIQPLRVLEAPLADGVKSTKNLRRPDSQLEALTLKAYYIEDVGAVVAEHPHLKKITFKSLSPSTLFTLPGARAPRAHLESIAFSFYCHKENALDTAKLARFIACHGSALKHLELILPDPLVKEEIEELHALIQQLPELQWLKISQDFSDATLACIADHCPKLNFLSCTNQQQITDEGINHLQRARHLTRLDLTHCDKSKITRAALERLKAALPAISVLDACCGTFRM